MIQITIKIEILSAFYQAATIVKNGCIFHCVWLLLLR